MELQDVLNYLVGIGGVILGWLWKVLWDSVERLKGDLQDLEIKLPETYVMKSDIDKFRSEIDRRFDRIETLIIRLSEKLDSKADK